MPTFEEQVARLRPQSSYENTDYIPSARLMQSLGNPDPQKTEEAMQYLQSTSGWGFLKKDEKDYFFNHYYQNGNTNKEQINKALESADISKAKDIADKTDRDRIVKELHPFINEALGKDPNEKTFSLSNPALDNGTPKDIKGLGVLNMDALAEENAEVSYDAYTVKSGDTLGKIAKANGLSLNQILAMNPDIKNPNLIKINQKINVSKNTTKSEFFRKIEEENAGPKWENRKDVKAREADLDNLQAIKGAKHSNNYVVIDKKNHTLSVFNPKGEELYKTDQISTGKSGNDYNTITYTNKNGAIINNAGNNSTPAGITEITGTADYHGVPAFTRARKGRSGEYDDEIASSFHKGLITSDGHGSNGCVRIDDNTLKVLGKYVAKGTKVYTLPEKEGSRFTLKQGKLSFTADNPYGIDEEVRNEAGRNIRFWDDYNTDVDRSYSPLKIETAKTNNHFKNENISEFINTVVDNKRAIQKEFGLTSAEYDELAHLAMGIAEQESKFGTSKKYIGKNIDDNTTIAAKRVWYNWIKGKGLSDAAIETLSRGITQIKYQGDNQELKGIYDKYGLTEQSIKKNVNDSAVATMLRLAYMYKNEIIGRRFTGQDGINVDPYDALLYKWHGKNSELKNHTATPTLNNYISNVREYMNDFNTYTFMDTQYAEGGPLDIADNDDEKQRTDYPVVLWTGNKYQSPESNNPDLDQDIFSIFDPPVPFMRPKFEDLPITAQREIVKAFNEKYKEYGGARSASTVAFHYNHRDRSYVDLMKADAEANAIPRIRANESPTLFESEGYENDMYTALKHKLLDLYRDAVKKWEIPFDEDRLANIAGHTTSLSLLDSLAYNAGRANEDIKIALGLAGQETQFGKIPFYNFGNTDVNNRALANSHFARNFGSIPAAALVRDFAYTNGKIDTDVPPLVHALKYYAKGKYNTGDPNHTSDVLRIGEKAWNSADTQRWWKEIGERLYSEGLKKGYDTSKYKALGGRLNLFDPGGPLDGAIKGGGLKNLINGMMIKY